VEAEAAVEVVVVVATNLMMGCTYFFIYIYWINYLKINYCVLFKIIDIIVLLSFVEMWYW
jgi:hypothetical protein